MRPDDPRFGGDRFFRVPSNETRSNAPMLLTRSLPSSLDLLALHRLAPSRYPLLLESSAHGTAQGRWDLLLVTSGEFLRLDRDGVTRDRDDRELAGDFLAALDGAWQSQRIPRDEPRWPFRGGWALLLGYELAAQVEPVLRLPSAPGALPVALALRCPAAVLRDHATGECVVVAEPAHAAMLDAIAADVGAMDSVAVLPAWVAPGTIEEDEPRRYVDGVRRILEYLAAGDVFQANLSRSWRAVLRPAAGPGSVVPTPRENNPAPFAGVLPRGNGRW
jgi:anthranilate synthase component 1